MTSTIADPGKDAPWYPRLLGGVAIVLGLVALGDLLLVPVESAEQVLFGIMFTGRSAQAATLIHVVFFAFAAWGCLTRKAFMVWVAMGYFVYLIAALWIWSTVYGGRLREAPTMAILMNALATVILLALCRVTFSRRSAFNG
jgi:hypothetical protein